MIHFLSGLPRSGSTLLASLLSQHSSIHATATNDLIQLVVQARNGWVAFDGFRAQGLELVKPRIKNALGGLLRGFYSTELEQGKTIIDKNRGWSGYIELMEDILERPVKILCPIRDLKDVVASFEKLRLDNPMTAPQGQGDTYYRQQSIQGRCDALFAENGVIGLPVKRILEALDMGFRDRLLLIPYQHLVQAPELTCFQVFAFLGMKPIEIDRDNVIGPDYTRDVDVWGYPLHKIRGKVDPVETKWQDILPSSVGHWIDCEFARFQNLLFNNCCATGQGRDDAS